MTARIIEPTNKSQRLYRFGVFIEKSVIYVVIFGIAVLFLTVYLNISVPNRDILLILAAAAAIYTLLYHQFVYFKNPTPTVALIDALVYSVFTFLLVHLTGGFLSPLFFLYLLPIVAVRLNFGNKLPLMVTGFIIVLNIFELLIQANPGSFSPLDLFYVLQTNLPLTYSAATGIISLMVVGLYIHSISIDLSFEHEETEEIKRLNSELKRIDKGKDEFISIASHEIRTPLTAIRGGLELMMADGVGKISAEQKDFVRKMLNSASRLSEVAEDTLSVSALERHRFTLKIEPFDVSTTVAETVEEEKDQALEKNVSLEFSKPLATLPRALADQKRISMVLRNLLDNAIKFTPSGGHVTISARSSGSKIVIAVEDSGVGIPHEELSNLFRKFYRVENVLNESSHGTGLGLYIVRLILNMHGETIGVESELGKGSTFTFTLKAVPHG